MWAGEQEGLHLEHGAGTEWRVLLRRVSIFEGERNGMSWPPAAGNQDKKKGLVLEAKGPGLHQGRNPEHVKLYADAT